MTKKPTKHAGGRPTKMTEAVIGKLEQSFAVGGTDLEACFFADIGKDVLYDYIKKHPEFHDRKESLKRKPVLLAKTNVVKKLISGSIDVSKWYLERRSRGEFATRTEIGNSDGVPFELTIKDYGKPDSDEKTEDSVELSA